VTLRAHPCVTLLLEVGCFLLGTSLSNACLASSLRHLISFPPTSPPRFSTETCLWYYSTIVRVTVAVHTASPAPAPVDPSLAPTSQSKLVAGGFRAASYFTYARGEKGQRATLSLKGDKRRRRQQPPSNSVGSPLQLCPSPSRLLQGRVTTSADCCVPPAVRDENLHTCRPLDHSRQGPV